MTIFSAHPPRRTGRARASMPLGLLLAIGMLAACGDSGSNDDATPAAVTDDDAGSDVDDAAGDAAATSDPEGSDDASGDASAAATSTEDQALAFAQCLRDEGLDVADPSPGQVGLPGFDQADPDAQAAVEICRDEVGTVTFGGGQMGENMADTAALLDFVDCLRAHDIEIGDPGPDGRLPMPDNVEPTDPQMQMAAQQCGHLLQGGGLLIGDGTGGGAVVGQGGG